MDHYNFTLVRQYDGEEYCQTVRIKLASDDIHAVASAFADFLESAGFQAASIQSSLTTAAVR